MRIVCIADTHGKRPRVPDGDLLIHAGDLGNSGSFQEIEAATEWLRNLPHRNKIVIAGNHDLVFERDPWTEKLLTGGLTYLRNSPAVIGGVMIYGTPYTPWFGGLAFNVPREEITEETYGVPHRVDILVSHGPPKGILDHGVGCELLRRTVERVAPRLHVFGHIHTGYGVETRGVTTYANAAHTRDDGQGTNEPHVFDMEFETAIVSYREVTPKCCMCGMIFRPVDEFMLIDDREPTWLFYHDACAPKSVRGQVKYKAIDERTLALWKT